MRPTSTIEDAERKLLEAIRAPLSSNERLVGLLARKRTAAVFACAVLLWIVVNHALHALCAIAVDPFPFRWLQWAFIAGSLVVVTLSARATEDRRRRTELVLAAERALLASMRSAPRSGGVPLAQRHH